MCNVHADVIVGHIVVNKQKLNSVSFALYIYLISLLFKLKLNKRTFTEIGEYPVIFSIVWNIISTQSCDKRFVIFYR